MPSRSRLSIHLWIRVTIAIVAGSAAVLLGMNVLEVVDRVDGRSHARDVGGLEKGLSLLGEMTAAEQVAIAVWDEAYEKVVLRRDRGWMRENLGRDVYDPDEERVLVVAGNDEILFSSRKSGMVDAARGDDTAVAAVAAIGRVRALHENALVETSSGWEIDQERTDALFPGLYDHDLAVVDGQPAVVTAVAFTPDIKAANILLDTPTVPTVLVHVRYLKGKAVTDLAATAQLDNVRLIPVAGQRAPDIAGRHVIADRAGKPIAVATWDSEAPGSAVVRAMAPTLALSALLIAVLAGGGSGLLERLAASIARRERDAVHAARHDASTGLANRAWFHQRAGEAMAAFGSGPARLGAVLVDLDHFKTINDTLGHAAGDAVILAAAERMKALGDDTFIAARLGGDEFAILTRPTVDPDRLDGFCRTLHALLMQPVIHQGREIAVSASVGAALFPTDGSDTDSVLLAADLALYRAKRDGRGCYRIYDRETDGMPGRTMPLDQPGRPQAKKAAA